MRLLPLLLLPIAALALDADEVSRADVTPAPAEFHFARMIYVDYSGARGFGRGGFGRGWWRQDWPEAEEHFTENLKRLTRVNTGESVTIDLTDEHLFDYPWLYATQVGYWDLSDEECARLREYLLRGGFLMADDFWNQGEMEVFAATMARVFPDRQMVDLPAQDAVLHVVFSVNEFTQIPGLRHLRGGGQVIDLPPPRWLGIYDDSGRLMVGINYNQDVGDSWEEANTPDYPEPMTALGYRFGINYIVYAMTH
ncbi:MAG TPA: DUF4159 domain-containing protein [Steroidobacteraceae bacterium]|nr:DUF4159 domain-containing protein [Steroidobacteraceae bacterium]